MTPLERITERVSRLGHPDDHKTPVPLLTLAEFFEGNDHVGSICCNLSPIPQPAQVYAFLKRIGHPQIALWLSALAFATIHLSASIFLPILLLGLVLAWLYEKTNNLLASITAHTVFNAINVVLLLYGDNLDRLYEQNFHH